jgi:hypothetical protein
MISGGGQAKLGPWAGVSMYGLSNELWNMGWILICEGSSNLQFVGVAQITLKGPYHRGASLALGWVVYRLVASNSTWSSLWKMCDGFLGPLLFISLVARWRATVTSLWICSKYWMHLSTLYSLVCSRRGGLKVGLNLYQTLNGDFWVLQCGYTLCANLMMGRREAQSFC